MLVTIKKQLDRTEDMSFNEEVRLSKAQHL